MINPQPHPKKITAVINLQRHNSANVCAAILTVVLKIVHVAPHHAKDMKQRKLIQVQHHIS